MIVAVIFELSLPLWTRDAVAFNRDGYSEAVPIAVIVQFVPVFLVVFATRTPHREVEQLAARSLWPYDLAAVCCASAIAIVGATLAAHAVGVTGTLAWYAPPVALAGMIGMGLVASVFLDHRVAGVVSLIPIIAPMVTNPRLLFLNEVWSFIAPGDGTGIGVGVAIGWLIAGLTLRTVVDRRLLEHCHSAWAAAGRATAAPRP